VNILSYTNCILDPTLGSGKAVLMFSRGMRDLGHTVHVCSPEDYETLHGLIRRAVQFRQALGSWLSLRRKLGSGSYDVIEFYGGGFWLPTWWLSKFPSRPLVVAHTNEFELLEIERLSYTKDGRFRNWFFRQTHMRFFRMAFEYADAFVALSESDRRYALALGLYPEERTAVVEPGLDEEYLSVPFSPNREERVAFSGTWIPRKGVDKVVRVMTKLLIQNPSLHLDIYGTWWGWGLGDNVLAGFPYELHSRVTVYPKLPTSDMARGLARAKVFFFPSNYEGFGIALAEAMACGCAVVTTPTGFGASLLDGKEALICGFEDIDAMERSVSILLRDDSMRQRIALGGWKRVRSLTWEVSVKKLEAIYSDWAKDHRSGLRKYVRWGVNRYA
jgi:glycosyltransferase involved in cell wall biosynthesis